MHPIEKGDISLAMITATFLRKRWVVLKPMSELSRYDLVIDRGNGFERVQCKSGRLRSGTIRFAACSSTAHHRSGNGHRQGYRGQIELFAVYCPDNDKCYLVPVDEVGETEVSLRIENCKNVQQKRIRLAADFEIKSP